MISTINQTSLRYLRLNDTRTSEYGLVRALGNEDLEDDDEGSMVEDYDPLEENDYWGLGIHDKDFLILKDFVRNTILTKHPGFPNLKYLYIGSRTSTRILQYFCHNANGKDSSASFRWILFPE